MIRMRVVHSNDDVVEQVFGTLEDAIDAARRMEEERHGPKFGLDKRSFGWVRPAAPGVLPQFGTDYHYVCFEEVPVP